MKKIYTAEEFIKSDGTGGFLKSDGSEDTTIYEAALGYTPANDADVVKKFIKSNEALTGAQRKDDVLYGILDQYTGEEMTLSKVTGTPTVDGIIYFQLGAEYFKRNVANAYNSEWWGVSTTNTSANNTTALQTAIDLVVTLDNLALIERKAIDILLPAGDIQMGNINFKGVVHLKGAGKTATRLYYNGDDYMFKGDTGNIRYGGISDMTMVSVGALNKGFIYMINCYNMTFDNINLNGSVFAGTILEHSIKLESQESWFVGANQNFFNVTISNFNINGGIGNGIHITGDFGSAQTTIKNGVVEAMDSSAIYITSTSVISNTNIVVDNVILQGYGGSGIELYRTTGFTFRGYFEQNNGNPAVILGGTKFVRNVKFHNSSIGSAGGFGGVIFKSGAGFSFSQNISFENLSITTLSTDILTDVFADAIKIKNIQVNNAVNINIFLPYDRELGNYEIDLGRVVEEPFVPKETLYNTPIPNGMISYFRGSSLINTSVRRQRNIVGVGGVGGISQFDINTDIYISGMDDVFMGNKNNYYPQKYSCFRVINTDATKTINFTVSSATINGLASFDVLPSEAYDVTFDGTSNFIFTLVSYGTSITTDALNLSNTPTTSAGTYDILTRNTSTGVVEKVSSASVERPYKSYVAILAQSGTSDPASIVLENTLSGAIVWTYSAIGGYIGTLTGAFTVNKTSVIISNGQASNALFGAYRVSDNVISLTNTTAGTGAAVDGVLFNATIEIRVYN